MGHKMVYIPESAYKEIQSRIETLESENESLKDSICDLADRNGQKVIIIHHVCNADDEFKCEDIELKDFEECRKAVEKSMRYTFEQMKEDVKRKDARIDSLNGTIANQKRTLDALSKKAMEAEMEVSRLRHRNLWQRIWNK